MRGRYNGGGGGGVSSAAYLAAEVFINVTFLLRPPLLAFLNEGAAQKGAHVLQSFRFPGALTRDSGTNPNPNIAAPGATMHFANRHTRSDTHMHGVPSQGKRLRFSKRSK